MILPDNLIDIFCTIQRGMLGNVTPNLRALYFIFENKSTFKLIFYYDRSLSEDEEDFTGVIDQDLTSDFSPPAYEINYIIEILPYPSIISEKGYCVYRRYEKDYNPLSSLYDF